MTTPHGKHSEEQLATFKVTFARKRRIQIVVLIILVLGVIAGQAPGPISEMEGVLALVGLLVVAASVVMLRT